MNGHQDNDETVEILDAILNYMNDAPDSERHFLGPEIYSKWNNRTKSKLVNSKIPYYFEEIVNQGLGHFQNDKYRITVNRLLVKQFVNNGGFKEQKRRHLSEQKEAETDRRLNRIKIKSDIVKNRIWTFISIPSALYALGDIIGRIFSPGFDLIEFLGSLLAIK